jgi:hypothetical protein
VARWRYADHDVSARVETLRFGDRIYLPGAGPSARGAGGRVVSHLEHYPTTGLEERPCVIVVYFTGERSRPLGHELGDPAPPLVTAQLRPLEPGTRLRCRRAERLEAA